MSVEAATARRDDFCECSEIEFDDGLERLGGRSAGEGFEQALMPCGVFGLQCEQFGDGIKPALGSGAFVLRPAVKLFVLVPSAVARLSLGVGQGPLALGLAPSGQTLLRHVTELR